MFNTGNQRLITKSNGNIGDCFLDDLGPGTATPSGPVNLPLAGPFAAFTPVPISGLTSVSADSLNSGFIPSNTVLNPLQYDRLTIPTTFSWEFEVPGLQPHCQIGWINELFFEDGSAIIVDGSDGTAAFSSGVAGTPLRGGAGGSGASGGGGGSAKNGNLSVSGGNGGSLADGTAGTTAGSYTGSFAGGAGGKGGFGGAYTNGYTFGNGTSGTAPGAATAGSGGNGFGGGGAGGSIVSTGTAKSASGSGGGGAGLSANVGNWLHSSGSVFITSLGGLNGAPGASGSAQTVAGGVGGDGVIYFIFKKRTGDPITVSGAVTRIFELSRDESTLTERTWSDIWNNLD